MIELHLEKGYYGIKENGVIIVPFAHLNPEGAIEEWEYFQRLNIDERQFLNHKRTHEEVDEIVIYLKKFFHYEQDQKPSSIKWDV